MTEEHSVHSKRPIKEALGAQSGINDNCFIVAPEAKPADWGAEAECESCVSISETQNLRPTIVRFVQQDPPF